MFELYNAVLRAFGNLDPMNQGLVPEYASIYPGESVRGRFVTTIHAINSGVQKLARLQPACRVYRGLSKVRLPPMFLQPDSYNVCGGVEWGFMSCTTKESVAQEYAHVHRNGASTVIVADMGLVDRGAALDWLSQYPEEKVREATYCAHHCSVH